MVRRKPPVRTADDEVKRQGMIGRIEAIREQEELLRIGRIAAATYGSMTDKTNLLSNLIQCFYCHAPIPKNGGDIYYFNNKHKPRRYWKDVGPCARVCSLCYANSGRRHQYVKKYGLVIEHNDSSSGDSSSSA